MADRADRERVLGATDIVALVGERMTLRPKGREFVSLCPFHDDHKPSMYVSPSKQIFKCFSCGAGGNAIDFVMRFHRMEFLEALRFLAERAGVELAQRERTGEKSEPSGAQSRRALLDAAAFAHGYFRAILRHPEHGRAAREILERRAMAGAIEGFELGAAADRWDGLLRTAEAKGVPLAALDAVGLFKRKETGRYDAMRNRVVFPIHDQIGRVIAFGGRRIDEDDEPKYLNSPESPLFDKSATLYGLHRAARSIQKERVAIVTEGYTDVIACHSAGVENVVATLGTALTPKHARALARLCDAVVLLFDGDEAGQRAADRALEVFFAAPIDVRIATLPGGADPDDLLRAEGGREEFLRVIAGAQDALEWRFARLGESMRSLGMSARARTAEEEVARLAELGSAQLSPVRRRMAAQRIARLLGVDDGVVMATLRAAEGRARARSRSAGVGDERAGEPAGERLGWAEHAAGALLLDAGLWGQLSDGERDIVVQEAYAASPGLGAIVSQSLSMHGEGGDGGVSAVCAALEGPEERALAAGLAARVSELCAGDAERLAGHLRETVARLRHRKESSRREGSDLEARLARERAAREGLAGRVAVAGPVGRAGARAGGGGE